MNTYTGHSGLNPRQYEQLLHALNPNRVSTRKAAGRDLSYLEAWDVKAHLIRIFGFGGWSAEVITMELAFEEQIETKTGGKNWSVGYRVMLTLTIRGLGCIYTEAAVGFAKLPDRGEAHDMAIKTAESDALKRAAINLGTQFGLSLYNDGSTADVIHMTLDVDAPEQAKPSSESAPAPAVTGISAEPEQTDKAVDKPALGNDDGSSIWVEQMTAIFESDNSKVEKMRALMDLKSEMVASDVGGWLYQGRTLSVWLDRAVAGVAQKKDE